MPVTCQLFIEIVPLTDVHKSLSVQCKASSSGVTLSTFPPVPVMSLPLLQSLFQSNILYPGCTCLEKEFLSYRS